MYIYIFFPTTLYSYNKKREKSFRIFLFLFLFSFFKVAQQIYNQEKQSSKNQIVLLFHCKNFLVLLLLPIPLQTDSQPLEQEQRWFCFRMKRYTTPHTTTSFRDPDIRHIHRWNRSGEGSASEMRENIIIHSFIQFICYSPPQIFRTKA